jgi:hypothetical protein
VTPPLPTPETAGVQVMTPPEAPPPLLQPLPLAVPPPPCLEAASVVALVNQETGEQVVDKATGLPMWLKADEENGLVVLGMGCAVQTPTFLPATGDGTAAPFVENYSGELSEDRWGYAEY